MLKVKHLKAKFYFKET